MFHDFNPTPTILVIDDSVETVQIVKYALEKGGFSVMTAHSGDEGLDIIANEGLPHLIIADLNMPPGMNGFEFCGAINRWCDVPVIILTAMDEADTVVEALQQHAEDYVVKPFTPEELLARVRRVLQRIGIFPFEPQMPLIVDDRVSIAFAERALYWEDRQVSLTPTEAKLLYLLLRRPGDTVSYDYLLRRMWPRELVYEDRLHVFVHRLRNKLIRNRISHQYIVLERGIGYLFNPRVKVRAELVA